VVIQRVETCHRAWRTGSACGFTKHVAVGFPYQPTVSPLLKDARVVGVPLRPAIATLNRAESRLGAREHFGWTAPADTVRVRRVAGRTVDQPGHRRCGESGHRRRHPVLHVIGARNEPVDIPPDLPVPYVSVPYIADMELGYAAADLVLSRGGAMTLAEVTNGGPAGHLRPAAVR